MKKLDNFCIDERRTIKEAISVIQSNLSRCVVVLNEDKKAIGVFSEGDVLRAIQRDTNLYTPLKSIVSPAFHYLNQHDILKAYQLVKKYGITMVPVINDKFILKSVITIFDVMDHLAFINDTNHE